MSSPEIVFSILNERTRGGKQGLEWYSQSYTDKNDIFFGTRPKIFMANHEGESVPIFLFTTKKHVEYIGYTLRPMEVKCKKFTTVLLAWTLHNNKKVGFKIIS